MPRLPFRAVVVDEGSLVLEHVAEPLPRDRWLADTSVMRSLAAVHRSSEARDHLADPFRPSWTPELTAAAVERLDPDDRGATARAVDRLSHEAERWLSGEALVSGDPNPLNWGQRLDGTLVLFDWERAGVATPAVDVDDGRPPLVDGDREGGEEQVAQGCPAQQHDAGTIQHRPSMTKGALLA